MRNVPLLEPWLTPTAFVASLGVLCRCGRMSPVEAVVLSAVAVVGVGLVRAIRGGLGGLMGRTSDVALLMTTLALMIAEPAGHRVMVGRLGVVVAMALAGLAVWSPAPGRRVIAALGGCVGVLAVPSEPFPAGLVELTIAGLVVAAVAWWLAETVSPATAVVVAVAVAVICCRGGAVACVLPVATAAGGWCVARQRPWDAALLAVLAAVAGPDGLPVAMAVVVLAMLVAGSFQPAVLLVPAMGVVWWQLPDGWQPSLGVVDGVWPVALLLPAALVGLVSPVFKGFTPRWADRAGVRWRPAAGALASAVGIAVAIAIGGGPGAVVASGLLALPRRGDVGEGWARRTLPWTAALAVVALLGSGWAQTTQGLLGVPLPLALVVVWTGAWLVTAVPHRFVQLAWLVPVALLPWVLPVEGVDRVLAAGSELRAPEGSGIVALVGATGPLEARVAGASLSEVGAPLRVPTASGATRQRWSVALDPGEALHLGTEAVVRSEPMSGWAQRRQRLVVLATGALVLAVSVLWLSPLWGSVALTWLLGWWLATACGVAPLARLGVRESADAAAVVWALAVAVVVPRLGRRWFVAGLMVLLPLALAQPALRQPAGDEVYHLKLAESLLSDGDLDITNNLDPEHAAEAIYLPHGGELIHSPTLALAVTPGSALAGHAGALAILAVLAAGAAALVARRSLELGVSERAVRWAWWLSIATYPVVTFATQLWPAVPGAFLVAVLLGSVAHSRPLTAAAALAVTLMVKVRLGLLALPVALAWAAGPRRRRRLLMLCCGGVLGVLGVVLIYGNPMGRHAAAELVPAAPAVLGARLWGLVWDGAGGLALHAPCWLLALLGVLAVWRRGGPGERGALVGALLTVLALTNRGEWYGGGSPPARYLVPLLPVVQLALAELLSGRGGRRLVQLAVPWTVFVSWVAATRPLWLFNPVDGGWWWVDHLGRSVMMDVRRFLPNTLDPGPGTVLVPLLLTAVAACWWRGRARSSAVVTLLLVTALLAAAIGLPSGSVEAEAGGIEARGGHDYPPPGTFNRAAGELGWRLVHDATLRVHWRLPYGTHPWARFDLIGDETRTTRLWVRWDGQEPREVRLEGTADSSSQWRWVQLPPPPRLGTAELEIRFDSAPEKWRTHVVIDRLEAR